MPNIVSFAEIDIEGIGPVDSIVSMSVEDGDDGTEVVHSMRRSPKGLGYNQGRQQVRITIEAKRFNPPEVDWWTWKALGQQKLMQYEELEGPGDSGGRWHLENARVISISKSREANTADDSIEILALFHGPQTSL